MEREKSDKFCSEALISAWGSFTCGKSTTRDPWMYFPSEGSHTRDFYALKNLSNPRTSVPEASMITTGPPGSTVHREENCLWSKTTTNYIPLGCRKTNGGHPKSMSMCRTTYYCSIPVLFLYKWHYNRQKEMSNWLIYLSSIKIHLSLSERH